MDRGFARIEKKEYWLNKTFMLGQSVPTTANVIVKQIRLQNTQDTMLRQVCRYVDCRQVLGMQAS